MRKLGWVVVMFVAVRALAEIVGSGVTTLSGGSGSVNSSQVILNQGNLQSGASFYVTFSKAEKVDLSSAIINMQYGTFTSSAASNPPTAFKFSDLLVKGGGAKAGTYSRLSEFTDVIQFNTGITGGVGVSGAAYIPIWDLLPMVDNNAVNVSVYRASQINGAEYANIALSGFTDPESLKLWYTINDSSGMPVTAVFLIAEEQTNQVVIGTWTITNTAATIVKGTSLILQPSGMWAPDATLGMEAIIYKPDTNELFMFKQDTPFEVRRIKLDGTLQPVADEPFDAETLWSATLPAINDGFYNPNTKTCFVIGDQTGASNSNQDILEFNCYTGAIINHWDNFPDAIGLNTATFGQCEGIDMSPDGENLWITSEGNEALWLRRRKSPMTVSANTSYTWERADGTDIFVVNNSTANIMIGTGTAKGLVGGRFETITTQRGNGAASETDLFGSTVTANSLAFNGQSVCFEAAGTFGAGVSADKRIRAYFGATTIFDSGVVAVTTTDWGLRGCITRTSDTAQKADVWLSPNVTGALFFDYTTPAQNTTSNALLRVTGSGTNASDVVGEMFFDYFTN